MPHCYRPPAKIYTIVFFIVTSFIWDKTSFAQGITSDNWSKTNLLGWDTGWTFKAGQPEPGYFTRNFNDSVWQQINYRFVDTLEPHSKDFDERGTIRRKFYVPDSMKGKAVELFFNLTGACEIYFDGKQIFRGGRVNGAIQNVVVIQKTIPLQLDSLPWHVVAIDYASSIKKDLINAYGLRGFGVTLVAASPDTGDRNDPYHHMIISLGIIVGFGLFFWFVFAFYPNRTASLLAALLLTDFSLIFFGAMIRDMFEPGLYRFVVGEKLWETGFSTSYGWWVIFLYTVYYKKIPRQALLVAAMMLTSIVMIILKKQYWFTVSVVFISLYVLECVRIIIKGLIKRKTGFVILAAGFTLSIIGGLSVIFNVFHFFPYYLTPLQTILGIVNDLVFPLTLALHLAWEFGSANRDLRQQLIQVKELSEKTLEQEKEKQQLLAGQNETLEQKVKERTTELNNSLQELKSTQAQLIQSEKMASLGQLTAGIAHEIQNPLNFVNNFSEINNELIEEAGREIENGKNETTKDLLNDIYANNEKIVLHGKRADAIVKGMLEHSRQSTGKKSVTAINALAEEYLKLAYHGMRAKDKDPIAIGFNVTLKTEFDENTGGISIVAQDIGRVLLNIYNNAFYAVKQANQLPGKYSPTVNVSTKRSGDKIIITVRDNGPGIPENIKDKIFQPFFTTKPTGQGTGLGLSLAYDIIKAHNGEIIVNSVPGQFSEFIISLPV